MKPHAITTAAKSKNGKAGKADKATTKASAPAELRRKDQGHKASVQNLPAELNVDRTGPLSLAAVSQLIRIIREELLPLDRTSTSAALPQSIKSPDAFAVKDTAPSDRKSTLMSDALDTVNGRLDFGFKLIQELKEKADPVLRPSPVSLGGAQAETERPPMPAAVAALHAIAGKLDYLNTLISDLVDRIEA